MECLIVSRRLIKGVLSFGDLSIKQIKARAKRDTDVFGAAKFACYSELFRRREAPMRRQVKVHKILLSTF